MRKILIGSTLIAGLLTGPALAADIIPRPLPPPPPPVVYRPPIVYAWTGCYIGGNVGWARERVDVSWLADPVGYPFSGPAVNASSIAALSGSSVIGGGQIGCNWQTASIVWGIEGDFDGTNLKADRIVSNTAGGTFTNEQSFKTTWLSTVRGRFGFLVTPNWLLFATGGAAFANVKYADCELHGTATTFCDTTGASGSFNLANHDATRAGYAVGGGAEVLFGAWSLKAEYLFVGLGSVTTVSQISPFVANDDITHFHKNLNIQTVRFGVNYHFNWGGPVVAGY